MNSSELEKLKMQEAVDRDNNLAFILRSSGKSIASINSIQGTNTIIDNRVLLRRRRRG